MGNNLHATINDNFRDLRATISAAAASQSAAQDDSVSQQCVTTSADLACSADYLAGVLASDASLRAAFEPVLEATKTTQRTGFGLDRRAFRDSFELIARHFDPNGDAATACAVDASGPPMGEDEAYIHFKTSLYLLLDRLKDAQALAAGSTPCFSDVPSLQPLPQSSLQNMHGHTASASPVSGLVSPVLSQSEPSRAAFSRQPSEDSVSAGLAWSLEESLEASRERVTGLRRALALEEQVLQQQTEEMRRLELLQQDLEGEKVQLSMLAAAAPHLARLSEPGVPTDGVEQLDDIEIEKAKLHGALERVAASEAMSRSKADSSLMNLQDLKVQLRASNKLQSKAMELEAVLDEREQELRSLEEELSARRQLFEERKCSYPHGQAKLG